MLSRAKYDSILVSDDNVRVRHDYLRVMATALMKEKTGLVSNLVVGVGAKGVGAICENLLLNTFILSSVAASYLFGYPVVIGKSMLFRREALMNAGGFAAFADVLAEDHLLGRAVQEAGYRVVTLGYPVYTVNSNWALSRTIGRHLRWCKIRASVSPWIFPFELFAHPVIIFTGTLLIVSALGVKVSWQSLFTAIVGVLLVTLSEVVLVRKVQGRFFRAFEIVLLPLRSIVALVAYVGSSCVSVVHWREQPCRIGRNSRIIPTKSSRQIERRVIARRAA
jgi:ceramide glucosyltransferase